MDVMIKERVEALRRWLSENNIDAIIIPHEDEFLGEYIPAHHERLLWATGFTGSAGATLITADKAAIFVDGRYTVQVTKQAPADVFEYCHLIQHPPLDWALDNLATNAKLAIDPKMHSHSWLLKAQEKVAEKLELVLINENPVDLLWSDRPVPTYTDARLMALELVGQTSESKRLEIADVVKSNRAEAALLTQLDSICWLLNVRGLDVPCLPVLLSHAIIHADSDVEFFIDPTRLSDDFTEHVGQGVTVYAPEQLESRLQSLAGKSVLVDPATSSAWFTLTLQNAGAEVVNGDDPCLLPKAAKNVAEIKGMRASHLRDGAAMVNFLSWLDSEVEAGNYHDEGLLADKLYEFRKEDPTLADTSFDTISASAGNGAMCHYSHLDQPEPSKLVPDSLYLVDSGGQYPDGTTDITRTIAIGKPSSEMIQQFTLVLKGHIGLANAIFPHGTKGHQLDILARQHLWARGYNFDHGTGHGVGHFLSVHEGPQRIGPVVNNVALVEGMVLSNEPGYYRADEFGIRIENLELVVEVETQGDTNMLGFESLTRCPIDKRNIDVGLLTDPELSWLNDYHKKVWDEISPLVCGSSLDWLKRATAPLSR
ncbi:aminopeptidase P family protein [Vibrio sp. S9_S30]|uniref:aminopeptidase P family protein n=1 Tax=Vibrio sp. S9_S30 TaxID=2720226 RepID=UPI001680422D|nr:aminopeptidase P family protein [Vibrio sp. S9_S30]MBD1559630.1 aminopeptidase P family protein [Vibrio sp. S9_S30]